MDIEAPMVIPPIETPQPTMETSTFFARIIGVLVVCIGILLIIIWYMRKDKKKTKPKPKDEQDVFKKAGIGSTKEILKPRATRTDAFEQKPGDIYDNLFHGKIVGLLSS